MKIFRAYLDELLRGRPRSHTERKASCPCGGGCPACQAKSGGLKISQPSDAAEVEADRIADDVMRTPVAEADRHGGGRRALQMTRSLSSPADIYRKCSSCENEDDEMAAQRKALPLAHGNGSQSPSHVRAAVGSGGRALDLQTRNFFESRLGYDLSSVRLHTGNVAAESALRLNAQAYTLGSNIVFCGGEYKPETESGRLLLAHDLAHVTQQNTNKLHRRLQVDKAASDDPTTAISMIDPLVTQLCPDFETNSTSGEIKPTNGTPCTTGRFAAIAGGNQPLGCYFLCTMARPWGANWKIVVSSTNAPSANSGTHVVRMMPTSGPSAPELRQWTPGPFETTSTMQPVEAFGHKLFGHAA